MIDKADIVRVNEFDQWVGKLQTLKAIELGRGKSLLDIGCGIGMFTPLFLKKFKRVVGLDPSEEYLKEARGKSKVEYIVGWGETFKLNEKFDTITMNMLLEHVDNPTKLLKNCKKHLKKNGRIIIQVQNANSITRRIGVIMGLIDSINNISDKERNFYGHQRVYTMKTLKQEMKKAGLKVIKSGGLLYKPLPNELLLYICKRNGKIWTDKFLKALVEFGNDKTEDCADLYVVCTSK